MFGSNHGGYLYVFDYGDFVKLGHTIKLRDRLYLFDRNVEEKNKYGEFVLLQVP